MALNKCIITCDRCGAEVERIGEPRSSRTGQILPPPLTLTLDTTDPLGRPGSRFVITLEATRLTGEIAAGQAKSVHADLCDGCMVTAFELAVIERTLASMADDGLFERVAPT